MTSLSDVVSVAQAAQELDRTPRAVLWAITSGRIAATKLGTGRTSAYVIPRAEVERVLTERHG